MRLDRYSGIACWFSGGRDSAVACAMAKRVADARGVPFKLVHIDTTIALPETQEYVRRYAEWLGAELVVLRPKRTFAEYAERYGRWPVLYHGRWCYYVLKRDVLLVYVRDDPWARRALHVLAVRRSESLFRMNSPLYDSVFGKKCHKNVCMDVWYPLLHADDVTIQRLLKQFGVPESPVWRKLGISGECLCLAGATLRTLDRLIANYPEMAKKLAEIDEAVHRGRYSKEPSYPAPLIRLRIRLKDYVEMKLRQPTLDDYLEYGEKGCGACLL